MVGNVGPARFGRSQADGANMMADALRASSNSSWLLWRAFVYGTDDAVGQEDLARQAYDTFEPLDGRFRDNVVLQIKNGPMDFQVREPISPLLAGGMPKSNVMMEVQAAQEYTGQQIHAVGLAKMWRHYLDTDTMWDAPKTGPTVEDILTTRSNFGGGLACVSNFGDFANYTGHVFAAANAYACGRLAWAPETPSATIDAEWAAMTFPDAPDAARVAADILDKAWEIYEGYQSPLGIGFQIRGNPNRFGCAPKTNFDGRQAPSFGPNPGAPWNASGLYGPGRGPYGRECPISTVKCLADDCLEHRSGWGAGAGSDHYWLDPCAMYDFQNSSFDGLGCDRRSTGAGSRMAGAYSPALAAVLDDAATCPTELLLFFHHVPWNRTVEGAPLIDRIVDGHRDALYAVRALAAAWDGVEAAMAGDARFAGVQARFRQQVNDAAVFSEVITGFYKNLSLGILA